MKKCLPVFLLVIAAGVFLFSCQRELFFDVEVLPSTGYLQDSSGNCLPKVIGGTYKQGRNTGDTNFLEVSVKVTSIGAYEIETDTVNGYSFKASGNFSDTGLHSLKLMASGRPLVAGLNSFSVQYNNSVCLVDVNVLSGFPEPPPPAVYTLQGAPDSCAPFSIAGNYIKDVSINSDDSVIVTLNVSVAGKYNIATNEVNGYMFYANGIVDSGLQKITLKGIGAPLQVGTDIFTVTTGNSICHFSVKVKNFVTVSGTDYFPLTINSYWTYDDLMYIGDTIKREIKDTIRVNDTLYHTMHEYDRYGGDNVFNYARLNSSYIQYGHVDTLTVALKYVPEIIGTIQFLKTGLSKGDSWMSEEYKGNMSSGQPVYLQYNFYCIDDNTAITIKDNSFINVYHILLLPQVKSLFGYPYNSTNEQIDLYYAKGIGIVYLKVIDNMGYRKKEMQLRYWKIY